MRIYESYLLAALEKNEICIAFVDMYYLSCNNLDKFPQGIQWKLICVLP